MTTWKGPDYYLDLSTCSSVYPCDAFGGTSSAAPMASGVAALLKSFRPWLLGEDLAQVMNLSAQHLTFPYPDAAGQYGWGLIRADQTLQYVSTPKGLLQGWLGPGGTYGALADSASVQVTETFSGVPGLPNGSYNCVRHRMVGVVTFPFDFDQVPPTVWARASGSIGWKDTTQFDYSYEVPWGRVVAGSLTRHGLRLETFVYDVLNGTQHVWEPAPPQSAQIAFTAVGRLPAGVLGVGGGLQGQLDVRTAPNPAKRRVIVTLTLPAASDIHAIVLDVAGRVVASIANGRLSSGVHELQWDAKDSNGRPCGAGVYFLRLDAGARSVTRKFIVLKG